jgi:hypothetical protein
MKNFRILVLTVNIIHSQDKGVLYIEDQIGMSLKTIYPPR